MVERISSDPVAPREAPEMERLREPQSIETWLNVFTNLMRLPAAKRESIRAELHAHLRERTRDLMLGGASEGEALTVATSELGEAAELARRFEQADRNPTRRKLMNAAILTFGVGAGILGIVTVTQPGAHSPVQYNVFEETLPEDPPDWFNEPMIAMEPGNSLADVFDLFARTSDDLVMVVDWTTLEDCGVGADYEVELRLGRKSSPARALDLLTRELNRAIGFDEIAWWYDDGVLEIGAQEELDRRHTILASYDVSQIVEHLSSEYFNDYGTASEQVVDLIVSFVSPDDWQDNGGVAGQLRIVGGRMFVEAPQRMHERVQWILGELRDSPEEFEEALGPWEKVQPVEEKVDLTLKPGDEVVVEVFGLLQADQFTRMHRKVEADGMIRLYEPIGAVRAEGLTMRDLENAIDDLVNSSFVFAPVSVYTPPSASPDDHAIVDGPIEPGDEIVVEVFELLRSGQFERMPRRVEVDGSISLYAPLRRFEVAGKTLAEVEQGIIDFLDPDYIRNPAVHVYSR